LGDIGERAAMHMLALTHPVLEVEIPVRGDFPGSRKAAFPGAFYNVFALNVCPPEDRRTAITTFKSKLPLIEL
jgi:hypothetical protein